MPPPSKLSGVRKIISIVWLAGIVLSTLRLMVMRHRQVLAGDLRLGADGRLGRQVVAGRLLHQRPDDRAGFGRAFGNIGALLVEDRLLADGNRGLGGRGRRVRLPVQPARRPAQVPPPRWRGAAGSAQPERPDRLPPAPPDRLPAGGSRGRLPRSRRIGAARSRLAAGSAAAGSRGCRVGGRCGRRLRGRQARIGCCRRGGIGHRGASAGAAGAARRHRGDGRAFAKRGDAAGRTWIDFRAVAVQPLRELFEPSPAASASLTVFLAAARRGRIAGRRRAGQRLAAADAEHRLEIVLVQPDGVAAAGQHGQRHDGCDQRREIAPPLHLLVFALPRLRPRRRRTARPAARSATASTVESGSGARPGHGFWSILDPASTGGGAAHRPVGLLHRVGKDVLELGERIVVAAGIGALDLGDRVFEHALLPLGDGRRRRRIDRGELRGDGGAGLLIDFFAHRRRVFAEPVDRLLQNSDKICHAFADLNFFVDRFLTANSGKNTAQTLDFSCLPALPWTRNSPICNCPDRREFRICHASLETDRSQVSCRRARDWSTTAPPARRSALRYSGHI